MRYIPPSTSETAFNCPHCGALSKQYWSRLYAVPQPDNRPLALIVSDNFDPNRDDFEKQSDYDYFLNLVARMKSMLPFIEKEDKSLYNYKCLYNAHVSTCYNCKDVSLWLGRNLVYPQIGDAPEPNYDLPEEILADYREASTILDLSPRGAAALVRLCIQKLCKHLGQSGENINTDIKALVAAGLDSRVQKALDAVRVIGNNAVHPGNMDLSDDRATAESLFRLLNLIAEKMISEPKHVDEVYALLPPSARAAIEVRDKKP